MSLKAYVVIDRIGEGAFATVFRAFDKETKRAVAIKRIKMSKETEDGVDRATLREIKLLQELSHPNVIELLNVVGHRLSISLVFPLLSTDLEIVINERSLVFTLANVKGFLVQMLRGVEHMHHNWMLHRDLKPNNVLISHTGVLKLTDFGLARAYGSPQRKYTSQVVTLWYRAPELLMSVHSYGVGVDMWAMGCIFAELMLRVPFIAAPENSEISQLHTIFERLGTPTEEEWPSFATLYQGTVTPAAPAVALQQHFRAAPASALQLLNDLLRYDPSTRFTATQALKHDYFLSDPPPSRAEDLPLPAKSRVETSFEESVLHKRRLEESDDESDDDDDEYM